MNNFLILDKLAQLPEDLKEEVNDFTDFLLSKKKKSGKVNKPRFGSGKGMFVMKPDFDEPLDDFKNYRQ
ncbi:MAG TPA: DUF2281 domain-containing protein [Chitinophagaceae bacterium]|nr:DUF2281 domain-containing protein [Chitinophagaceae bacterium]